jgi:hypothetical protein
MTNKKEIPTTLASAVIDIHKLYGERLNLSMDDILHEINIIEKQKIRQMIVRGYSDFMIRDSYKRRMVENIQAVEIKYNKMSKEQYDPNKDVFKF